MLQYVRSDKVIGVLQSELQSVIESILSAIAEAVLVADEDGVILFVNHSATALFKYTRDQLLGKSITRIMPAFEASQHSRFVANYLSGNPAKIIGIGRELNAVNANGELFPVELNLGEGCVGSQRIFTAIFRDLRTKKRHQQEMNVFLSRHNDSLLIGGAGVWELDVLTMQFNWSNPHLFGGGIWKESFSLNDFLACVHEDDRQRTIEAFYNAQRLSLDSDLSVRIVWPTGAIRWLHLQVVVQLGNDGGVVRLQGMVQDVTSQYILQDKLHAAKESAEQANMAKTAFLSSVSHELRTPLNAIIGFNQLLALQEFGELNEQQEICVNRMGAASNHLLSLVDEVLDFARVEAGQCELSMVSCNANMLIQECIKIFEPLAAKACVTLDFEAADIYFICADSTKFKQVVINLISNALKYGAQGRVVNVEIQCDDFGRVAIGVLDRGAGILPHYRERLFLPFDRLGHESAQIEGTGIGLALTKKLMELMGGDISYRPREGGGSEFWVRWSSYCVSPEVQSDNHNNQGESVHVEPCRIIYLDENSNDSLIMRYILRGLSKTSINIIYDSSQLAAKLQDSSSSLVIVDLDFETPLRIEALKLAGAGTKIVVLSQFPALSDLVPIELLSACTLVTKPIDVSSAAAVIRHCMNSANGY